MIDDVVVHEYGIERHRYLSGNTMDKRDDSLDTTRVEGSTIDR